ncbi:MAG: ATP-dependent DNA ligase [Nanoarchaeota archaeon]|nr:ATP-dependent DNA ligase [Nanoarchaeota archaeon]
MKYSKLAELYEQLENTSKNLEKTSLISEFLKIVEEQDIKEIILLIQGRVFPKHSEKEIGIANNLVVKLLKNASGATEKEIKQTWNKTGDLGITAEQILKKKKQITLKTKELSVQDVITAISSCAEITGKNAISKKINVLSEILSFAKPIEAKYIVRTILNMLRVGVASGLMRDAISTSFDIEKELIQKKYDLTTDFGEIALTLKTKGKKSLEKIKMRIGTPVQVMLYNLAKNVEEGFKMTGKPAAIEFKYDGMRMQIHKEEDNVIIFTRRLDNVTKQFPDVVKAIKQTVKAKTCILDAEAVAYNPKTKEYLPFQYLSKRIKRKKDILEIIKQIPVVIYVFDVINYENENVMLKKFDERRAIIKKIITPKKMILDCAEQLITSSKEESEKFYSKALSLNEEGIMMKNIESTYIPGRRVGSGVKIKPVMETLDLAIIGGVWGEGKRSKWLSSFILSCKKGNEYLEIGKMGSGFSEEQFAKITNQLKKIITRETGRKVYVKPEIIVEVAYEEIQKSPTYSSGFALRFPRLVNIRDDLSTPNKLEKISRIYSSQKKVF